MSEIQNFNIDPYYDDYDEDKKFLRMLFRPGYAVQARELTQLQSILQRQITRFGDHIFKNGSVVTGGQITFDNSVISLRIEPVNSSNLTIDLADWLGKSIGDEHALVHGGAVAKVITTLNEEGDSPTLIIKQTTGAKIFSASESIFTIEDQPFEAIANIDSNFVTSNASIVSIDGGVFYIDGFFVDVDAQTIVLDQNSREPDFKIGLVVNNEIVGEQTDTSLLDPALNASNYQAPGATRYKVQATLSKRALDSEDDTKFIELLRIETGTVNQVQIVPIYNELEKILARRTYDESGNYTVEPFVAEIEEHIPNPGESANNSLFSLLLSPGLAYIYGYEYRTASPIKIDAEKAREKANVTSYEINVTYGNYFVGANLSGFFDISTMPLVDIHCVKASGIVTTNTTTYSSTKIGTTRVRQLEYSSAANTSDPTTYQHLVYIFDPIYSSITANATGGTTTTINLAIDGTSSTTANAYVGASIRITTGPGSDGFIRTITEYDESTLVVTVNDNFFEAPDANSVYVIEFNIRDAESFVANTPGTPVLITANVDVTTTNKEGSVETGYTFLSDTDFNKLVCRFPDSYVDYGTTNRNYRGKLVSTNQGPISNVVTISTGSASTNFVGDGSLSDSDVLDHFIVVTRTAAAGLPAYSIVPMTAATGRDISVTGGTSADLDLGNNEFTAIDVIATVDFTGADAAPRSKSLTLANTTNVATGGGTTIGNTTIYLSSGQVAISTPNKTPGLQDNLYVSDIFKLDGKFERKYGRFNTFKAGGDTILSSFKVVDSGNTLAAVVDADLTDLAKDITYKYILNTGQRDNFYDYGSITLNQGSTPPTGQILVLFDYFTHSGTGYLSVDSYIDSNLGANTEIRYPKIPIFSSPVTKEIYVLRDCIDFRPIRTNASATSPNYTLTGVSLPKKGEGVELDYSYYLSRSDRLVLKIEREFELLKGISSELFVTIPNELENSMSLYTFDIPPFTFFPEDIQINYIENKRYTMRDIGLLDRRLKNVEYYTSLNTIETRASEEEIVDSTGLVRFKNGLLIDAFTGHGVGDVSKIDYFCSIDEEKNELRAAHETYPITFSVDEGSTDANISSGHIVTNPYTVTPIITQDVVSSVIKINPFLFSNFVGVAKLFPASDVWIDTKTLRRKTVNLGNGDSEAWDLIGQALSDTRSGPFAVQWGSWQKTSVKEGSQYTVSAGKKDRIVYNNNDNPGSFWHYVDHYEQTYQNWRNYYGRVGTQKTIVPERVTRSIGNVQVDLSTIPYIRAQTLNFEATGLAPNLLMYSFFDDVSVDNYAQRPSNLRLVTGSLSDNFLDTFGNSEKITSTSGGTATVIKQIGRSWSLENPKLYVMDVIGTFAPGDTITGSKSGATAELDIPFMLSGSVSSATSSTITLSNGMPYNNVYVDFSNTMLTLVAANTFPETRGTFDTGGVTPAQLNSAFAFNTIKIVAGPGLGQERTITGYNGATKVATINSAWTVRPTNKSVYSLGNLQSDDAGIMVGRFHLPNNNNIRFKTGVRKLRVCDSSTNNPDEIISFADIDFFASGVLNTVQPTSVSVTVPKVKTTTVFDSKDNLTKKRVGSQVVSKTDYIGYYRAPGGGGCGSIICTKLHELGYLPERIYIADEIFGEWLRQNDPDAYFGYLKWAAIVVDWMSGEGPQCMFWIRDKEKRAKAQKALSTKWAIKIATPWAHHMAHLVGIEKEDNRAGRAIMKVGLTVSRWVGRLTKPGKPSKSVFIGYTMWMVFTLLWLLSHLKNKEIGK